MTVDIRIGGGWAEQWWGSGGDGKHLTLNCKEATPLIDPLPRKDILAESLETGTPLGSHTA